MIPNYNYARYLDQRFRSILGQTCQDFELIFLDDASTDESVELVRKRYSGRIAHFETSTINSGNPFMQWNRGVRLARGAFVWIAEADDVCAPLFLERMLQALEGSPRIGLAYCYTTPIDHLDRVIDAQYHQRYLAELHPTRWRSDFVSHGRDEVRSYLSRKNPITNVSGVVFRRAAYEQAGFAPEDMRMCGDWMTYCRVLHDWDVAFVADGMNFHRQHEAKHTQNSVLDLTYFREFLRVQQYAAEAFHFGSADRAAAFRRFLLEWDRLTVSNYGRLGLGKTLTLARITAARYRRAGERVRIAGHFALNVMRSLAGAWKRN